jgi:hypothetical protein
VLCQQNAELPAAIYPFADSYHLGCCISAISSYGRMIEAVRKPPDAPTVATALVRSYARMLVFSLSPPPAALQRDIPT